jgi:hypothetical protein
VIDAHGGGLLLCGNTIGLLGCSTANLGRADLGIELGTTDWTLMTPLIFLLPYYYGLANRDSPGRHLLLLTAPRDSVRDPVGSLSFTDAGLL